MAVTRVVTMVGTMSHDQGYHGNGYDNYASAGGRGGGYDGGRGGFKNWEKIVPSLREYILHLYSSQSLSH